MSDLKYGADAAFEEWFAARKSDDANPWGVHKAKELCREAWDAATERCVDIEKTDAFNEGVEGRLREP